MQAFILLARAAALLFGSDLSGTLFSAFFPLFATLSSILNSQPSWESCNFLEPQSGIIVIILSRPPSQIYQELLFEILSGVLIPVWIYNQIFMRSVPLLSPVFRCDVAPNYLCAVSPMPYNSVSTQAPYLTTKQQELIMCAVSPILFLKKLSHSALPWILSKVKNLARSCLQYETTDWLLFQFSSNCICKCGTLGWACLVNITSVYHCLFCPKMKMT